MNDLWLSIGELGQPLGLSVATTHRIVFSEGKPKARAPQQPTGVAGP